MQPNKLLSLGESEDVFFGTIGSLAADSKGNIFVTDRQVNHVIQFGPDGGIIGTLGR